jgi:thioredoxin:protein disulfide reductase
MKRGLLFLMLSLLLGGSALAKPWWMRGVESNENDFLPPDVAFRVGAQADAKFVRVRWVIADGYYLYRSKISVVPESPDLVMAPVIFPPGTVKRDPYLGINEVYTQQVEATVPYHRLDYGAHPLQVKVTYQGCAEAGLCYPLITKVLFPTAGGAAGPEATSGHLWQAVAIVGGMLAFLVAGLLLRKGRKLELPA